MEEKDKHFMNQAKSLVNTSIDDVRQKIAATGSKHILMAAIALERNSTTSRSSLIKLLQAQYRKLEKQEQTKCAK